MVTAFDIVEQAFNVGHCLHLPCLRSIVDLLQILHLVPIVVLQQFLVGSPVGNPAVSTTRISSAIATAETGGR